MGIIKELKNGNVVIRRKISNVPPYLKTASLTPTLQYFGRDLSLTSSTGPMEFCSITRLRKS